MGEHEVDRVDVVVVGAGLAGLTSAAVAAGSGARVVVLDAHSPGGRAATAVVDPGVVFNSGPRAIYRSGAAWRVLTSLGIDPRGGIAPADGHGRRDGTIHRLPGSPLTLATTKLLGASSKLRVGRLLAGLQRLDAERFDDCSVRRWLEQSRLDEDARQLVRTVIRTVTYVDDVDHFSAGTAIRQMQMGLGDGVRYLDEGWQQLVDALLALLDQRGVVVVSGAPVRRIEAEGPDPRGRTGWRVSTADRTLRASSVVVAAGGPDAVDALLPVQLDRSGLGGPATAACLELAVRRPPSPRLLLGIGEPLYLSAHTPTARLAPDGIDVVHVLRYGARSSSQDRPALWAHAAAAGITSDDVVAHRFLRAMVVTGGIPVASAGGQSGRPPVQVPGHDGLLIAGDWVGDEGLLADAAVASGERAGRLATAVGSSPVSGAGVLAG